MAVLNPLRHLDIFDPNAFGERRVDVIGGGESVSQTVMLLAKLGIRNIHLWHADPEGRKIEGIAEQVKKAAGTEISLHNEIPDASSGLGEVVFLLADSALRKEAWENALRDQFHISLVVSARVDRDEGHLYSINPTSFEDVEKWEGPLCSAEEVPESAWGPAAALKASAIASTAAFQLIRWFAILNGRTDAMEPEILLDFRGLDEFDAKAFGDLQVHFIGAGATGSQAAMLLAKLGVRNIHVSDFDVVKPHNVANQLFTLADAEAEKPKIEALKEAIKDASGTEITTHNRAVDGSTSDLGNVVFLLTDSMKSRKEIWEGALKGRSGMSLMIETRMGAEHGRIYAIDPHCQAQVKGWEGSLHSKEEQTVVSACGATSTVGATALLISTIAAMQFVRWFTNQNGRSVNLEHESMVTLRPALVLTRKFS